MRTDRTAGALGLASALGFIAGFGAPPLPAAQDLPFDADAGVRSATAEDIRIMTPYIGRFRSPTRADPQSGEPVYHEIEYRWVDQGKTSVAVEVTTHGADSGEVASFVRGYYGFDPFEKRLFAVAVFSWGGAGLASVGEFDHATGHRVVHARMMNADGSVTHIRDVFDVIADDRWRDRTYARTGQDGQWTLVYEDEFTRVE